MPQFRIFLGAPSRGEAFRTSMQSYQWQTVESKVQAPSVIFPPATLEAASRRISLIYQNIIFKDQDHQDPENSGDSDTSAWNPGGIRPIYILSDCTHSKLLLAETTAITWPPSTEIITDVTENINRCLLASSSASDIDKSAQETEETISYNYSDASSIGRFPSFTFNLHSITSLSTLVSTKRSRKINVLVAALEVEGPDTITIKKGSDAGKQVSILKMILGDDLGNVAKLTAWRGVADSWGGNTASAAVKRGDIIYLQGRPYLY